MLFIGKDTYKRDISNLETETMNVDEEEVERLEKKSIGLANSKSMVLIGYKLTLPFFQFLLFSLS